MMVTEMTINRKMQCFLLLIAPMSFIGFIFVIPITKMLSLSFVDPNFTLKHYLEIFNEVIYYKVFWLTFKVGISVTLSCLLLGYPVAYFIANAPSKYANLLLFFVIIPLWTSMLVRTYAWMVLLGRNGVLNNVMINLSMIEHPVKMMHNTFGVYLGMTHILLPFMILPMYSVMRNIDRNLVSAAKSLGAGPFRSFIEVYLPLSMPGVVAAVTLVFIISLGFFITPELLGGLRDVMISMLIERQVNDFLNWGIASALSLLLLLLTGMFFLVFRMIGKLLNIEGLRTT